MILCRKAAGLPGSLSFMGQAGDAVMQDLPGVTGRASIGAPVDENRLRIKGENGGTTHHILCSMWLISFPGQFFQWPLMED